MSVINQVLNQLEQRGAYTAPEQTMVRAVPQSRRSFTMPLLAFALALIAGFAAWQWVQQRKPEVVAVNIAPKAGNTLSFAEPEKLTPPQQPAAALIAPNASTGSGQASGVSAANPPARLSPPLQLSFELSSAPLPSVSKSEKKGFSVHAVEPDARVAAPPVRSQPKEAAAPKTTVTVPASSSGSPIKQVSPEQRADAEFRKAVALMQQGRIADAQAGYEAALRLDAGHDDARQSLVALLLESKRGAEAERVLQERLKGKPDHTGFTILLARLQVDRGAIGDATATLEKSLSHAGSQPDYLAFLAALLQRQDRHEEAIAQYKIVTQLAPGNGVWLMGYGISLQAIKRNADAKEAFRKALETQTLSPDLQAFVQQRLKEL
ncbi:MAG: hypothetical protein A2V79_07005 [Betaproteobacteria bacterium RBG_16_56_24]|nr:MAG: hypothetical protein A2V79_07005 [Betaproteobacteria bacterium RBG_16_56_24]